MNTNDLLLRWASLSLDQIEDEIRAGKDQESTLELLGPETVAEIQAISFAPPASGPREPVVLLPGIMGSLLTSIRGVTTLMWINPLLFVRGDARYLRMKDDGSDDEWPEVEVAPIGLEKLTYLKMSLALNREALLYEFPYDWRREVAWNAERLHERLERWAAGGDQKFTLLAHSMGGLVSRAYLALHPREAEKRIRQVVMLGTPHFGATNAIETLFSGNSLMATVDRLNAGNEMTDVVRSMPGVYNLLPAPPDLFPGGSYPANWDLYDAEAWHLPGIRKSHLQSGRRLHELLAKSDPQVRMVMIAGCNMDTLVGLEGVFDTPALRSAAGGHAAGTSLLPRRVASGEDSGDGTVPLWSARYPKAETYYVQEKHGDLPNNRQLIGASLALLRGEGISLPLEIPEPRGGLWGGLSFEVPEEATVPTVSALELEEKIRAGVATKEDLKLLYFAM